MKTLRITSQIFWPEMLLNYKQKGYLIGWNLEHFHCCIVTILPTKEISYNELNLILKQIDTKKTLKSYSKDGSSPIILGEWIPHINNDYIPLKQYQQSGIWLTLTLNTSTSSSNSNSTNSTNLSSTTSKNSQLPLLPILYSLYSCGGRHQTSCHMIKYKPIQRDQLYCLVPADEDRIISLKQSHKTNLIFILSQINNVDHIKSIITLKDIHQQIMKQRDHK